MSPTERDRLLQPDLAFFGQTTASVSHELKNKLAIIKEEAGLISDFLLMAERGRPLDPARLKSLTEKILGKVELIDDIVKRLNRFAHTIDDPSRSFDPAEILRLAVELYRRPAAMKKVELTLADLPATSTPIVNDPFNLIRLLAFILEAATVGAGEGGELSISMRQREEGAEIVVGGRFPAAALVSARESSPLREMLERAGAELAEDKSSPGVWLRLPRGLRGS